MKRPTAVLAMLNGFVSQRPALCVKPANSEVVPMNESSKSKVASGKARDTHHPAEFDEFGGNTKVPEAMRVLAEKNLAQARELYDHSRDALEAVLASWEKTFDAAGQGVVALNRKAMDITQQNINSGFEYAKSIANAKNLTEAMELQIAYWRKQLSVLGAQAEELRTLSTEVTTDITAPIAAQVKRGMDELHKTT
jgi:hypothetical protein